MKKIVFGFAVSLLSACNESSLNKEMAAKILKLEKPFPDTMSFAMFTHDVAFAKRMLQHGLEEKGLIRMARTKRTFDTTAWITITDNGKRYLLTPSEDDRSGIQRVKTGTRDLGQVIQVDIKSDRNHAIVWYTVVYRDLTPFAVLIHKREGQVDTVKSYMQKVGADWHIDKKPDIEYLMP